MRVPSVLMIRQPPAYVPSPIASAALTITQSGGRSKSALEVARGDERERDDPHRLLRVVRPVRERDEAARDELQPPEDAVDGPRCAPANDPEHARA